MQLQEKFQIFIGWKHWDFVSLYLTLKWIQIQFLPRSTSKIASFYNEQSMTSTDLGKTMGICGFLL